MEPVRITEKAQKKSAVSLELSALPASTTHISREEIERTNVGRDYTDMLRRVPGVVAHSYGQGDVGSPIIMRGSGSTHGRDVAIYVDGVPQSFPSAAMGGSGMSDLSWLAPDMIESMDLVKGTASVLYGDQNSSGALNITTRREGKSSIGINVGSFGAVRTTGVYSGSVNDIKLFGVADYYQIDGYRKHSDQRRGLLMGQASMIAGGGLWSLRANYYKTDWNAPGYLNYPKDFDNGKNPKDTGFRDDYPYKDDGDGERYSLALNRRPEQGDNGWHATAFVDKYKKRRLSWGSNAIDDRTVYGGRALYHFNPDPRWAVTVGADMRGDHGKGYSYSMPFSGTYNNYWDLNLLTYGVFGQAQWEVVDNLKLMAGARYDRFDYKINNRKRANGDIDYSSSVFTPRAGVAWTPIPQLELYANMGEGFRAPAAAEITPGGSSTLLNLGLKAPKYKNKEVGFSSQLGSRVRLSGNWFEIKNENEIRTVAGGKPGEYESIGRTNRRGWETDIRYDISDDWSIYASYSNTITRKKNPNPPGQDRIYGLPQHTYRAGVEYTKPVAGGKLKANADAYQTSGKPFYANNVLTHSAIYRRYDLRLSYEKGPVTVTAYGTFQPNKLAGEEAVSWIDPRPRKELGVAVKYQF